MIFSTKLISFSRKQAAESKENEESKAEVLKLKELGSLTKFFYLSSDILNATEYIF